MNLELKTKPREVAILLVGWIHFCIQGCISLDLLTNRIEEFKSTEWFEIIF